MIPQQSSHVDEIGSELSDVRLNDAPQNFKNVFPTVITEEDKFPIEGLPDFRRRKLSSQIPSRK